MLEAAIAASLGGSADVGPADMEHVIARRREAGCTATWQTGRTGGLECGLCTDATGRNNGIVLAEQVNGGLGVDPGSASNSNSTMPKSADQKLRDQQASTTTTTHTPLSVRCPCS